MVTIYACWRLEGSQQGTLWSSRHLRDSKTVKKNKHNVLEQVSWFLKIRDNS